MTQQYCPYRKGTVLIPSGPSNHLHIICCDPVFYPRTASECVLVVNVSSIKQGIDYDRTCELRVGDHPFIVKPSYIYYRKADVFGSDNISRCVADGTFTVHQDCSSSTFERILAGFEVSEEVRPKVLKFYRGYCC